ncbi:FG-GAP-like repeat-containing protein [Parapedobacter sp. 2B3]|uniref:FG-GAP-like repeat-containing protein n=1 Tax=Parapedobacter sp. 2B3 TaxID=3342381 RepID=UPI0035B608C4
MANAQPPVITSFSPTRAAAGSSVTITGTGFNPTLANNIVYVGWMRASVMAASTTSLTVMVPAGASYGPISVLNTATRLSGSGRQYFLPTQSPFKPTLVEADLTFDGLTTPISRIYGGVVGDLNGDNKPDLVINDNGWTSTLENTLLIQHNTGTTGGAMSFSNSPQIFTFAGYNGQAIASLGDMDGDGLLDIIAAANLIDVGPPQTVTLSDVFVLRNQGNGTFIVSRPFTTSLGTEVIRTADIDGDGLTDVAALNYHSGSVSILRNTSSGIGNINFALTPDLTGIGQGLDMVLTDINGDGKPDIVTLRSNSNGFAVFLNTSTPGNISFTSAGIIATNAGPNRIIAGDIDGDGYNDLVVTSGNSSATTAQVFHNRYGVSGSLDFSTVIAIPIGDSQQACALGDINGDGKPDLAISSDQNFGSADYRFFLFRNTSTPGAISFGEGDRVAQGGINGYSRFLAIADMNADGKQDVLAGATNTGRIGLYRNTLQFPPIITSFSPATAAPGESVTLTGANFNTTTANNIVSFGGVKAAITAASTTQLTVTVPLGATHDRITVLNTANNLSGSSPVPFSPSFSPNKSSITALDFAAEPGIAGSTPFSVAYGDFDGDGRADMAVANAIAGPGNVSVFQNTGSAGTVSYTQVLIGTLTAGNSPRSVAVGDIDGDGKPDLVVTDPTSARIHVFRNTSSGSGDFSFSDVWFTTGANIISVAIGDIDGDGRPDVAVTGEAAGMGYVYVHRNLGSGPGSVAFDNAYTTLSVGPAFGTGVSIVIADINRDGKAELLTSNVGDQLLIFPNTSTPGSVSFDAAIARTTAGVGARYVAVGDLDGDGMPDIAVANGNTDNISVFRNTGLSGGATSITATDAGPFPVGDNPFGIAYGDVNGDGRPDIVTANQTAGSISILRNTSTGTGTISFAAGLELASGAGARYPTLADMDGDGRLDIAVANQSANTVSFFRNAPIIPDASGIVYVNANTPAPAGDGSSWASAYHDLAPVLAAAKTDPSIRQIWVAKGTYKPKYRADDLSGANPTGRDNAFVLVPDVKIYGGFYGDGTETDIDDRTLDGTNETILSGDIDGVADGVTGSGITLNIAGFDDNAYHVVISADAVGTAGLNGFTVTGGYADGIGDITVNTITTINQGYGGGLHLNGSSPEISHVKFIHNFGLKGGGMSNQSSSPTITHSVFSENQGNNGAGSYIHDSSVMISHSVFSGNKSGADGAGIYVHGASDLVAANTVFSGNHAGTDGMGIYHGSGASGKGTFINMTMAGNTGGGVAFHKISTAPVDIRNSIVFGGITASGSIATANSLIEGSTDTANGNIDASGITLAGIFDAPINPVGADGTWGTADDGLALNYSSANPVINAGNNTVFDAGQTPDLSAITTDIAGNPRKWFTVDAGAYELQDYGPTAQASAVTVNHLASASATVSWTNGDGGKRVVFVSDGSTGEPVPVDGTSYTANAVFGAGTEIGSSGWYAVYNGTGTTVAINGLSAATPYRVMVVEYNETLASNGEDYLAISAMDNPVNFTTMAQPPVISSFAPATATPGESVILTGTGFHTTATDNTVFFGPVKATVTGGTATSLTVTVPVSAAYAPVAVLNTGNGLSAYSSDFFLPGFQPNKDDLITADFKPKIDLPSGAKPESVAIIDFDGDGKPDLASVNYDGNTVSVFYNTGGAGSMSFADGVDYATGTNPASVAVGDIDGDGKPDMAVTNFNSDQVTVYRNTSTPGNISFAGRLDLAVGGCPFFLIIRDLDGDGKADIATANKLSNTVSVLWNTGGIGNIVFDPSRDYAVGAEPYSLAVGDIDGDHKPDLITANYADGSLSFLRNISVPGAIDFAAATDVAVPGVYSVSVGDLDGDGKLDLVTANLLDQQASVLRNTSTVGNFSFDPIVTLATGDRPYSVAIGDLNGDGKPDVAIPNYNSNTISVFSNTGSAGTIGFAGPIALTTGVGPAYAAIGDLDGDGKPDLATANYTGNTVSVLQNQLLLRPATQASDIVVSDRSAVSATISWTSGNGAGRMVLMKEGDTGSASPVDGMDYEADSNFGSGHQLGSSGWYALYNGTGNTVAVSGLSPSTTYRIMVVEYNDNGLAGEARYQTAVAADNPVNFTTLATLDAIVRADANPTNAATVAYTVTFGSAVSGLTPANFSLTTGIADASVVSVSPVGTDEKRYTITVGTGSEDGDITLELSDAMGLTPGLTNTLPVVGETYTIDKTTPVLTAVGIVSDNADASRAGVDDVITLDFTSSEPIAVPTVTIATHTVTATHTGGNNWTASYTLTASDAEDTVPFSITYSDLIGNTGATVAATTDGSSVTVLSSAAALQALTLSSGTLSPVFSPTVYQYAASVPYATASVTLVPTAGEEMRIEVDGVEVASGTASPPVTLITGANTIEVAVTSENGTVTQYYTLTITRAKATQVITFAALAPYTFGDMDMDPGATASSGLVIAYASDNPAVATIVDGKIQITGAGTATITASQAGNAEYLPAPDVTSTLTVERRPVTIGFAADAAVSKEYDGTTRAEVTVGQLLFMVGDVLADDEVRIGLATASATYDTEEAGTDKLVTLPLANVSLAGADAKNYRISNTAAITANAGTIAKRALTITANNHTKLFDGEAYSGGNGVTYDGFVPGEDASVLSGTLVYGGASQGAVEAGEYTIEPSGHVSGNYVIAYIAGKLTISGGAENRLSFNVQQENGTVTRTYGDADVDGSAIASSGLAVRYASSNEAVAAVDGNGQVSIRGVGTAVISASQEGNVNYAPAEPLAFRIEVERKALEVRANNAIKTYDGEAYSGGNGVSYEGFIPGESALVLGGTLTYGGTSQGAIEAGTYAIEPQGLSSANYEIGYANGTLIIAPADGNTLAFNSQLAGSTVSVTYGWESISAAATSTKGLPVSYISGNESVATVDANGWVVIRGVGTAVITAQQPGDGNHSPATSISFTLSVAGKPLVVTANNAGKVYDGEPYEAANGVQYTGFVYGEDASVLGGTLTYGGTAQGAIDVGSYFIEPGGLSSVNYAIEYRSGSLSVTKKPVTVRFVPDAAVSKEYDGATLGTITANQLGVAVGEVVNGDDLSVSLSAGTVSYRTADAGEAKPVTLPLADITLIGNDAGNYSVGNMADITASIGIVTKRLLTVTASSRTKVYDGAPFSGGNGVTYDGFIAGEDASVLSGTLVYGGSAQGAVDADSYDIIPSGLQTANYALEYRSGALLITPATRSVVFPALPEKAYGDADFDPGATASSGEAIGYYSDDLSVAGIVNGRIRIVGAGEATITAVVPENGNYSNQPTVSQTLTVHQATQAIVLDAPAEIRRDAGSVPLVVSVSSGLPVTLALDDPEVATLDGTTLIIHRLGTVRITARQGGDANHEAAAPVTVTVRVTDPSSDFPVRVSKAVSPNGDGINEYLIIEAIKDHPDNRVRIFNRNGTVVYEASGYNNGTVAFRGVGTGQQPVAAGTYFYVAEIRAGGEWKYEKGWFVLRY